MTTYKVKSNKGKFILIHNNFDYHFRLKSRDGRKIYWRCSLREICNATCVTGSNLEGEIIVFKTGIHNHQSRRSEIVVRSTLANIRQRALDSPNQPPSAIVQEAISTVNSEEALTIMPERQALLRTVNRKQNETRPPLPQTINELEILHPYNVTLTGQQFIIYDSGRNNPNRCIIFATEEALRLLSLSPVMLGDGTFKTVLQFFSNFIPYMAGSLTTYILWCIACANGKRRRPIQIYSDK